MATELAGSARPSEFAARLVRLSIESQAYATRLLSYVFHPHPSAASLPPNCGYFCEQYLPRDKLSTHLGLLSMWTRS